MTRTQDLAAMTGIEQLQAIGSGVLPHAPIAETLGLENVDGEVGAFSVELVPHERHYNPLGSVHGGVLATMLDTAAACSVHSTLAAGEAYTSLDLTVKFLRPATVASGRLRAEGRVLQRGRRTALAEAQVYDEQRCLRAEGRVLQRGRRTALAEAQVYDEQRRLVAHATSSCMIFS